MVNVYFRFVSHSIEEIFEQISQEFASERVCIEHKDACKDLFIIEII